VKMISAFAQKRTDSVDSVKKGGEANGQDFAGCGKLKAWLHINPERDQPDPYSYWGKRSLDSPSGEGREFVRFFQKKKSGGFLPY